MFNQLTSICVLFYLNADIFCSSSAKLCPLDKYYNPKTLNCTDCLSGYYGSNCSNSCPYPSYGEDCQEECHCPKKVCDHVFGCSNYELNEIIRLFSLSIATQCRYDKYYNTKINNCTDCLPGYYGLNCRESCRYPNYGVNCQEKCNCSKIACNHIIGCFYNALDGHANNNGHLLIIGLLVGIGVALIIVAFFIITARNRRFYTRQIRENAHYIGSVVTEHSMTTNMYNPSEPCTRHCSESEATDSGVYMLAGTLRYEHRDLE